MESPKLTASPAKRNLDHAFPPFALGLPSVYERAGFDVARPRSDSQSSGRAPSITGSLPGSMTMTGSMTNLSTLSSPGKSKSMKTGSTSLLSSRADTSKNGDSSLNGRTRSYSQSSPNLDLLANEERKHIAQEKRDRELDRERQNVRAELQALNKSQTSLNGKQPFFDADEETPALPSPPMVAKGPDNSPRPLPIPMPSVPVVSVSEPTSDRAKQLIEESLTNSRSGPQTRTASQALLPFEPIAEDEVISMPSAPMPPPHASHDLRNITPPSEMVLSKPFNPDEITSNRQYDDDEDVEQKQPFRTHGIQQSSRASLNDDFSQMHIEEPSDITAASVEPYGSAAKNRESFASGLSAVPPLTSDDHEVHINEETKVDNDEGSLPPSPAAELPSSVLSTGTENNDTAAPIMRPSAPFPGQESVNLGANGDSTEVGLATPQQESVAQFSNQMPMPGQMPMPSQMTTNSPFTPQRGGGEMQSMSPLFNPAAQHHHMGQAPFVSPHQMPQQMPGLVPQSMPYQLPQHHRAQTPVMSFYEDTGIAPRQRFPNGAPQASLPAPNSMNSSMSPQMSPKLGQSSVPNIVPHMPPHMMGNPQMGPPRRVPPQQLNVDNPDMFMQVKPRFPKQGSNSPKGSPASMGAPSPSTQFRPSPADNSVSSDLSLPLAGPLKQKPRTTAANFQDPLAAPVMSSPQRPRPPMMMGQNGPMGPMGPTGPQMVRPMMGGPPGPMGRPPMMGGPPGPMGRPPMMMGPNGPVPMMMGPNGPMRPMMPGPTGFNGPMGPNMRGPGPYGAPPGAPMKGPSGPMSGVSQGGAGASASSSGASSNVHPFAPHSNHTSDSEQTKETKNSEYNPNLLGVSDQKGHNRDLSNSSSTYSRQSRIPAPATAIVGEVDPQMVSIAGDSTADSTNTIPPAEKLDLNNQRSASATHSAGPSESSSVSFDFNQPFGSRELQQQYGQFDQPQQYIADESQRSTQPLKLSKDPSPSTLPHQLPPQLAAGQTSAVDTDDELTPTVTQNGFVQADNHGSHMGAAGSSDADLSMISTDERKSSKGKVPRTCRGCEHVITGKSVRAKDGTLSGRWHRDCLKCRDCESSLAGVDKIHVLEDQPFCARCYHIANMTTCSMCNEGIEGPCLETRLSSDDGQPFLYHINCLRCSECQIKLQQTYFDVGGQAYCAEHAFSSLPDDTTVHKRYTQYMMI